MAASGVPGYETGSATGLFAPGHTPAAVINRLSQEVIQVLQRADVKEKFLAIGVEVVARPPVEFAATIKSDITRMGKLIKDAGIRAE